MIMKRLLTMPALLLLAGCETGHYAPPPPVAAPPPPAPPRVQRAPEPWVDVSITTSERQVIQGYVAGYVIEEKHPKKGKKPKSLPPGLQKKLDRGALKTLNLKQALARRKMIGAPGTAQVRRQLARWRNRVVRARRRALAPRHQ